MPEAEKQAKNGIKKFREIEAEKSLNQTMSKQKTFDLANVIGHKKPIWKPKNTIKGEKTKIVFSP